MFVFAFPDVCVWGKHSAWMSTTPHRAEARTHHPQRNSAQKPSSGRKGDRDRGGRSLRSFQRKNTTKENSLVVFVFSPLRMQRRGSALFIKAGGETPPLQTKRYMLVVKNLHKTNREPPQLVSFGPTFAFRKEKVGVSDLLALSFAK